MLRQAFVHAGLTMLTALTVCALGAEGKKYQALEERNRMLSLPPGTWEVTLGSAFHFGQRDGDFDVVFDPSPISLVVPYIPLGTRVELHVVLPHLQFYPVKNVVEHEDYVAADGPNLVFRAGMTNLWYNPENGIHLAYGGGYGLKVPVGHAAWVFSNALLDLDLDRHWTTALSLGVGFQITDHLALILSGRTNFGLYNMHYVDSDRETHYIGYTVELPINLAVNRTKKRGFLIRTGFSYTSNTYDSPVFWGIPIGLQYSWHW